jgi:hypothetical protein
MRLTLPFDSVPVGLLMKVESGLVPRTRMSVSAEASARALQLASL